MALIARYLIDTSAAARMTHPVVRARLEPLIIGGVVATCATLDAEALYSARSAAEYEQIRADRAEAYEYLPIDDEHWRQAFAAQRDWLAQSGTAPSASPTCSPRYSPPSTGSLSCTTTPTSRPPPRSSASSTAGSQSAAASARTGTVGACALSSTTGATRRTDPGAIVTQVRGVNEMSTVTSRHRPSPASPQHHELERFNGFACCVVSRRVASSRVTTARTALTR